VTIRLAAASGGEAVIEIEDRGIGMTEEEQQRALQPFGQAKPVITRGYGGTGLGLPISKGLVEAHGGSLRINSARGSGTVVRVSLPTDPSLPGTDWAAAEGTVVGANRVSPSGENTAPSGSAAPLRTH
jgi:signal transduction histidine kinase